MTSAAQRPPKAGGLGGVAIAAGVLGVLLLGALLVPVQAYIQGYVRLFDLGAVPLLWVIAIVVGIVAVRSGRRADRILGVIALVFAALILLAVAGYVVLRYAAAA